MKNFSQVYAALRRRNKKQYGLLAGCCFFSVLLITAYASMMRAPTILSILPEGGDSRKQVMMVFVLAVIGCGVFTTYASSLFFRQKSRETGVFLALGATRKQLKGEMIRELALLSLISCAAGAVLGAPLAWAVWQVFRAFVVDTEEMALVFSPQSYLLALAFSLFVIVMLFLLGGRSIRRTNIMDIVQESHRSEPIRDVPRWYGPVGVALLAAGGFLGYMVPSFFILALHWYPPEGLTAVFYLPALAGLYMLLLHTVVNGWSGRRGQYKDLISTSQMRFQGRQTVRNMLVMTLLIAGAYFASFYTPMLGIGTMMTYDARPVDYEYHFRNDQDIPGEDEVRALAADYGVTITSWAEAPMLRLGVDGWESVEEDGAMGTTWHAEYRELLASQLFLPESGYNALTGEHVDLAPGTVAGVFDASGSGRSVFDGDAALMTNTVTGERLSVTAVEGLRNDILFGRYVMDDGDYAAMAEGLPAEWRETTVAFNVEDCADTYEFAKALFHEIVDRSGPEVEQYDAWDPVRKQIAEDSGEAYVFDRAHLADYGFAPIDYAQRDSFAFRSTWQYMPQFRVLDKADFVKTTAVFLTLFILIALICFAAVIVIAFTRCMTIALISRRVYDDLRHLGAPNAYLYRSVRSQVKRVFFVPAVTGTALIYAFYAMIMYFNDNRITDTELAGMIACLGVIAAVSVLLYGIYRLTLKKVCGVLDIKK